MPRAYARSSLKAQCGGSILPDVYIFAVLKLGLEK